MNLRFESETEKRTYATSTPSSQRKRVLLEEYLENNFKGSIYHPNLVEYDLNLENGLDQNKETVSAGLDNKIRNRRLNRYHFLSSFLRKKPYAFSLFADQSFDMNNHDFFERQYIDWSKYGGNFGYQNDFLPAHVSFSNDERIIRRASRPSQDFRDDQANLSLNHTSGVTGETRFDITRDNYSRTESENSDQTGVATNYNIFNQKYLFDNRRLELNSSLRSNALTGTSKNKQLNVSERVEATHTDSLSSSYIYDFSDNSSGTTYNKNNRLNMYVRHHLYESLFSSLNLNYFTDQSTSLSQNQAGMALNEDYVKKLGTLGRLTAGTGLGYESEKRQTSQDVTVIAREPHTLTTGTLTFLELSHVDTATIVVTDSTGTIIYIVNVDYQLTDSGSRTQIQRVPGGAIANGQSVLVDYHAASSPLFSYNTVSSNYRVRLDFFEDLVGVYYRRSKNSHPSVKGEANAILESLDDTSYGVDLRYRNLTVEWENQDYGSTLSPYQRQWLKETLRFNLTSSSTYMIQSSQSNLELVQSNDIQKYYDIINQYTLLINQMTRLSMEGGYRRQKGGAVDINDYTLRCIFETSWGNLSVSTEYDFEKQLNIGEGNENHFFYSKIKRTF